LAVAGVISQFIFPDKTNRDYLEEIIESGYIEKAASEFIDEIIVSETGVRTSDFEWEIIKDGLSECMLREAKWYLKSGDPYLDKRANKETPIILAKRLLKACHALE